MRQGNCHEIVAKLGLMTPRSPPINSDLTIKQKQMRRSLAILALAAATLATTHAQVVTQ